MPMIPEVLSNTSMFIDGISFDGDAPSVTLPKVTLKMNPYRGGGMAGEIEIPTGVEKMEASFTTNGARRDALKWFGLSDRTSCSVVFRGAFRGLKGRMTPVIATMRGGIKEVDMGDWKAGDPAETKHAVSVNYYKLEVGGVVIYEIDMVGNVLVVNGVDQLADERSALGL
ncbi:Phage major tail tube protein [Pseudomonas chlororaphis subsp. aurantiaca]|uniref:phage major tail tube protein n=1 Tax=Pseudomonas chlororaphis TaxID=587753 RepID=UPI000F71FEF3|nr:phage major tail tube protein [Pseudomonas chlororaphis]AZD34880.1 Phage major tail tube protein [Pseudomonas chlororaphis subsp. aurantiaca]AZD41215.1 Phage major tail tube protein [Pseudomonas chlororaphis subsp. aurantiaca]